MSNLTASFSFGRLVKASNEILYTVQRQGREIKNQRKEKNHRAYGMMIEKRHKKGIPPQAVRDMKALGTNFIDKGSDLCH